MLGWLESAEALDENSIQSLEWHMQMAAWHLQMVALSTMQSPAGCDTFVEDPEVLLPVTPPPGLGFDEENADYSTYTGALSPFCTPVSPLFGARAFSASPIATGVKVEQRPHGQQLVRWTVHAKVLTTLDKSIVSPEVFIDMPKLGPQPFKVVLYPVGMGEGKGAHSFKRAKGNGRIELTYKADHQKMEGPVTMWFSIGGATLQQPLRGPVMHNFCEQGTCRLRGADEVWDFASAVDSSRTFVVSILVDTSGEPALSSMSPLA